MCLCEIFEYFNEISCVIIILAHLAHQTQNIMITPCPLFF